ncbi:MAG TPA: carboxypeptidase regulatory-like domain-containing protein [Terriglobales bacterium]
MRKHLCVTLFVCLLAVSALGQKITGTIHGVVTDSAGAVVPNAEVTVVLQETGEKRTATTNGEGGYVVTDLAPGTYTVSVKQANFKQFVSKGVQLNTSSNVVVNAELTVGSINEEVTVEAGGIQVETQSGSVGNVVEGNEVRELPLNGRSFVQLTQLMPGVSASADFDSKDKGITNAIDFSVNGNGTTANLFLVDGVNNNDVGAQRNLLIFPSIDAISEFKILRNSYPPEYGQASGAIISIITRGGTNQWHGTAFYAGRNDALNATDFFNTLNGNPKDALRRNDWGYTIGGPIVKDKLFFFWEQEWNHEQRGLLRQAQVPTAAEKTGDFSQLQLPQCEAVPSFNNQTFTNINQVPTGGVSQAGLLLLQLYPDPNIPQNPVNCVNWSSSPISPIRWREENIRGDYNLTPTLKAFARYTHDSWSNAFPQLSSLGLWGDDIFPAVESSWAQPAQQATVKLTKLIGSNQVNDFQLSYAANKLKSTRGGLNPGLNDQINQALPPDFPFSDKSRGADIGHAIFWGGLGSGTQGGGNGNLWTQAPWHNYEQLLILKDDFSRVQGAHTFKVGFLATNNQKTDEGQSASSGENVSFWGAAGFAGPATNNGVFNALWDQVPWGGAENQGNPYARERFHDIEFYFGDTWKATRRLTLEYGFRWSFLRRPYSATDHIANFVPSTFDPGLGSDPCNGLVLPKSQANACANAGFAGGTVFNGDNALIPNNNHTISPRVGIAWDIFGDGKTALRAGAGQFFLRERIGVYDQPLALNPPFNLLAASLIRTLDTPAAVTAGGQPTASLDQTTDLPNSWQWNLTIERELAANTKLEVAYVGNSGIHLFQHNEANPVPKADWLAYATGPGNGASNPMRTLGNSFGGIVRSQWSGNSNYHALQALFRQRIKSLDAQFAYTWSHSLSNVEVDNSGGANNNSIMLDPFDQRLNYGNTQIDRPQVFVANLVYNIPTFAGHGALTRTALGGWSLAGILNYANGTPLTVFFNNNTTGANGGTGINNSITGTGASQNAARALRVSGQSCLAHGASKIQWLNPAAFTLQGFLAGTVTGDAADPLSAKGGCPGPGIANTDFSVHKDFKLTEKLNAQFRVDFFNVFNKTQFLGNNYGNTRINNFLDNNTSVIVCTATGVTNFPTACPNGVTNRVSWDPAAMESSSFGQVTRDKGPREIQYQLKFEF